MGAIQTREKIITLTSVTVGLIRHFCITINLMLSQSTHTTALYFTISGAWALRLRVFIVPLKNHDTHKYHLYSFIHAQYQNKAQDYSLWSGNICIN